MKRKSLQHRDTDVQSLVFNLKAINLPSAAVAHFSVLCRAVHAKAGANSATHVISSYRFLFAGGQLEGWGGSRDEGA